jgi:hypothetical protein
MTDYPSELIPQQEDCEDSCGKCYTCLNLCCPNCLALLVEGKDGDESCRKCPDGCGYKKY